MACLGLGNGVGGFFGLDGGASGLFFGSGDALVFGCFTSSSAGFELINATFYVKNAFFTGEERVRRAGNVYLNEWVFVTVFPLGSFGSINRGTG